MNCLRLSILTAFFFKAIYDDMHSQGKFPLENWYMYTPYFRKGEYKDALESVQTAWIYFCENILILLSKEWNEKKVRANKLVSEVVTNSDEAFAIQEIEGRHIKKTIHEYRNKRLKSIHPGEDLQTGPEPDEPSVESREEEKKVDDGEMYQPKKPGRRSAAKEKERIERYYQLLQEVRTLRSLPESKSWDVGYRDAIIQKQTSSLEHSDHTQQDDMSPNDDKTADDKKGEFPVNFVPLEEITLVSV